MSKKVLIVDDDIDVINIVETILKNEGYTVITANDKKEGIKKLQENQPDLAILDVMMTTHFEGFELAKEIGDVQKTKKIPVLIQTSIEVLDTTDPDVIGMAREYRRQFKNRELDVLLIQNNKHNLAGIDYINTLGQNVYISVDGFVRKPVEMKSLLREVKRLIG